MTDFDLHFLHMNAKVSPFAELAAKLAARPKGRALVDHRKGAKGFKALDPEGHPSLQFAVGARIVGM